MKIKIWKRNKKTNKRNNKEQLLDVGPRFFFCFFFQSSTYIAHRNSLTFFFTLPLSSFSLSHTHFVSFILSFLTAISRLSSPPPLFFFYLSLFTVIISHQRCWEDILSMCAYIFLSLSELCACVFVLVCVLYAITRWVSKISRVSQEAFSKQTKKKKKIF